ncbi:hypothetical protein RRG08_029946 [Elysia crispata]|uniref:Uncharacterized protein n=1 Tax=Elysia crispata TaxID=231223 RepID=A0AAE0ZK84_9GAST|nr:hypothetical protein RRG08_029946 [Elysia crispata]
MQLTIIGAFRKPQPQRFTLNFLLREEEEEEEDRGWGCERDGEAQGLKAPAERNGSNFYHENYITLHTEDFLKAKRNNKR